MAHRLDGCDARLGRAREHLKNLNAAVQRFLNTPNSNGVLIHFNHDRRQYTATAVHGEDPPREWGLVIGEALYHMRSALDHLVWQLVLENRHKPQRWNQFPVYTSRRRFRKDGVHHLVGVAPDAAALIEEFQPFDGWKNEAGGIDALWLLDLLCNVDKHRALHLAHFCVKDVDVTFPDGIALHRIKKMARGPLKHGTVILRCNWSGTPGANAKMQVQLKLSGDIAFDHRSGEAQVPADLSGIAIVESLTQTLAFLRGALFPAFLKCFR